MSDASPESGWDFGKVLGLIIGLIGMVGFGACALWGLTVGFNSEFLGVILVFSLPGLGIAFLCFLLVLKMVRLARGPQP